MLKEVPESVKPTYEAARQYIKTKYKEAKCIEEYLTLALEMDAFVEGVVLTCDQILGGDCGIGKDLKELNVRLNIEKCSGIRNILRWVYG